MEYEIKKTEEFEEWFTQLSWKSKLQIEKRLENIQLYGHFGLSKQISENIFELKWVNGWRIYFCLIPTSRMLLLLGGNKNGQDKDIKRANKIYEEYA